MEELISIIVPVYKVEPFLDECVASIVAQTHRNFELILIDDGSPDRCPTMCDVWAKKDKRIKVIHKKNGGASSARNAGLEIARGTYIGFVDSDDMIRPDMYETLLKALRTSQKKIACCDHGWSPNAPYKTDVSETWELDVNETVTSIFTRQVGTSVWRRLYHRSVWENLRFPEGEINEDYPLLIPTAIAAGGMVVVRAQLYFYRPSPDSVTSMYWKSGTGILLKNLEQIYKQINENNLNCLTQFRDFAINAIYSAGIAQEKHLHELNNASRKEHQQYLQLMRKLWFHAVFGKSLKMKDKILYCMILMRILRPVYRLMGRL